VRPQCITHAILKPLAHAGLLYVHMSELSYSDLIFWNWNFLEAWDVSM